MDNSELVSLIRYENKLSVQGNFCLEPSMHEQNSIIFKSG
ncbi:hypothetical protein JCM19233_5616 [Vibrio astriarenae]|nr:hypothetical protein JCM19233_5616 [Vibrio sp. C7]